MSSEIQLSGLIAELSHHLSMASSDDLPAFDPVMMTAEDRSSEPSLPPLTDPASDHFDPEVSSRRAEIDEKQRRMIAFLEETGHEAVVLTRADSIAWFTAGADVARDLGTEQAAVALFINPTSRAVLTDNVQSARVFEEELAGLGFQLKERPWHLDPSRIIAELSLNKKVATDGSYPGLTPELERLTALRRSMTDRERFLLRGLGRAMSRAVEATCRSLEPGATEADVAGNLAHRLYRDGITPVELRVAADDRLIRHRRPHFKASTIRQRVTIEVAGRRQGLHAALSRTVSFGPVSQQIRDEHTLAAMVGATCIYFSRPRERVSEVYRRAKRIFEKFGHPHEWMLDYQGSLIGYNARETVLMPDSALKLPAKSALRWGPSVRSSRSEDTIFIDEQGFDVITNPHDWPIVEVCVKGFKIHRPGILERS